MLTVFAATFVLFLLIVGGMSLGYVFKRKACRAAAAASPHWDGESLRLPGTLRCAQKREAKAAQRREQLDKHRIL